MNNYNLSTILELVTTKDQADSFVVQLENLTNAIYDIKIDIAQKFGDALTPDKKEKILVAAQENQIQLDNPEQTQNFITDIIEAIKNLPTVEIQIAKELNERSMNSISSWLLLNLKRKILIKVIVSEQLIGGVILGFNGIYRDYSVKKTLEEKIRNGSLTIDSRKVEN